MSITFLSYEEFRARLQDAGLQKQAATLAGGSLAGVTAVALQPGHVRTDMNSGKGRISARESARGLRRVLDGLTPSSAGKFLDWRGRELPW